MVKMEPPLEEQQKRGYEELEGKFLTSEYNRLGKVEAALNGHSLVATGGKKVKR